MAYIYDLTDTWSAAGTVFNGIKLNVTNTASAAGSKLMTLQIGGTEFFGVSKEGDVRIGNGGDLRLGSATGTTTSGGDSQIFNDANNMIFTTGTTAAERVRINSSGNVGIGTSSPGSKLSVAAGNVQVESTYGIVLSGGTSNGYFVDDGSVGGKIQTGGGFRVFTGGANERMRITSGGFLLVGTTSPLGGNTSSEFKVTGAGAWPLTLNAVDRGLLIRNSAPSAGVYAYFEYNGGTNNGQISFSGGTTSYVTTSDARVKKNIVDAPDAGSLIDAIKVRSWDFKVDDMHWRYGMVAQELLPIAPEAVTVPEEEDRMMGIDYSKLVPMLIKEVQSLRARVAQLEGN